ncbi:MAG TPA: TetR/AcrR family transcriptional regulator [Jatrophihabitantaceae bacterium]
MDEIVDAATGLFGARGIKGTTIAAIAERVGLTDAGVLHHFPTKAALVEAALERGLQHQIAQLQEFIAPGGLEAIRGMAAWGQTVEESPELVALQVAMSAEAIFADSPLHDYAVQRYRNVHDLAAGLIREGIDRGEIRPEADAEFEASALIAYLDGVRLQWFLASGEFELAAHVRHYVELLVDRLARQPRPGKARR